MNKKIWDFLKKYKIFLIVILGIFILIGIPYLTSEKEDYIDMPKLENKIIKKAIKEEILLKEIPLKKENYLLDIPFICQAPYAEWDNSIFQDGCEEAASLMAVYWALDKKLDKNIAQEEIIAMADYQKKEFGQAQDTSSEDTNKRLIKGYFGYNDAEVRRNININDIIEEIKKGNAVIVPANGQLLGNPYFTQPGPERHNLLIRGYNEKTKEFITNDPGTKRGEEYHYNQDILYNAIRDYPTGYHEPIEGIEKLMIVIEK